MSDVERLIADLRTTQPERNRALAEHRAAQRRHVVDIDGQTDPLDPAFAAFCECGWNSRWFHADEHGDPATDEARDAAYDEAEHEARLHADGVL